MEEENEILNQPEGYPSNKYVASAPEYDNWSLQHNVNEEPIYPSSYNIAST